MTKYEAIRCIINGYKIVENIHLTETEPYEAVRSWKERLFTFPWKPLVKYKTCCRIVPSKNVIITDNMIVCHPVIAEELIKLPF